VALGEGLVGQCALEKKPVLLDDLPPEYVRISSGLGSAPPRSVLVLPLVFEGSIRGVLELASLRGFNPTHQAFLEQLTESIGIVLNTIEANMRTEGLLSQSQSLAQQLQTRQEELQKTNQELQEKSQSLALQNQEVERKNAEVETARQALEDKAKQLALTSKYKSEFLANMSHELRTPLNSLLILSDQLSKNPDGNLTPKQQEFSKTIHSSGNDLLTLINDILDLSKIESGTVEVEAGELRLEDLRGYVERTFGHVAENRNLGFQTRFNPLLPRSMTTDAKRLQQIIKNLLSNAFKFTHKGEVTLTVEPAVSGWSRDHEELNRAAEVICFTVSDTGIGIPADKQQIIFEAFQQADGSTSRKYGGTGLGLAISRELSRLLGGEIRLASTPNRGSTFQLFLPATYTPTRVPRKNPAADPAAAPPTPTPRAGAIFGPYPPRPEAASEVLDDASLVNEHGDDRDNIRAGDRVLLIVENDPGFARFLLDAAREKGFKALVTALGSAALTLTREYNPDAVTLDIHLPDINGWRVLERMKKDPTTRHVPVCVVSTDDARDAAMSAGCLAFLGKPIQSRDAIDSLLDHLSEYLARPARHLLVIEPDAARREQVKEQLADPEVLVTAVADTASALRTLADQPADCVVLGPGAEDLVEGLQAAGGLPDADGESRVTTRLPVIVYAEGSEADPAKEAAWRRAADVCTVRRAPSSDALLDLTTYFLHRPVAKLPEAQRRRLDEMHQTARVLEGRKVLIVDDDMRNIFALSAVLEEHDMVIVSADNGRDAIRILQADPGVDIVLMDIMMPEMDGMETMREIRKIPHLKELPIVAVTAKAMKGDREKCIEAGAWDYLSKPVSPAQLLAVLRAWLHR
jgi:signal transduction histidine kinase/CheY-like chemotaxis protein